MTAREIAHRHGLHPAGRDWRGDCPACGYRDALVLTDRNGRMLAWCASCQDRDGLWRALHGDAHAVPRRDRLQPERTCDDQRARARRLWAESMSAAGTIVERYLASRHLPIELAVSPALRFHGRCPRPGHGPCPAVIAAVTNADGEMVAVHRTYLRSGGCGKAEGEPVRAFCGPVAGGAVRLLDATEAVAVGEGIETAAAAGVLTGLPAWAALSAGNLESSLMLPAPVRSVTIAVDRDAPGERAADGAARRWRREGRSVRFLVPDASGADAADLLRREAADA